jgi:methionyl-tRNA formyltransferase
VGSRIVVLAYHEVGYVCLQELLRSGDTIAAVITHADDPAETIWFRSVRRLASEHGLPVFSPANINTAEWIERFQRWQPDFIFSFYYRSLIRTELLSTAARGALNLHGSLLPRYRGRCPVNWVLIHDEWESGVTLHYMEEKPDRGDIVAQRAVPIADADTARTLFEKLTSAAAGLLRDTYPLLRLGIAPRQPQNPAAASYFGGRRPADGRIDWHASARAVFNLVRAVTHPYPGAFANWQGRKLLIWDSLPLAEEARSTTAGTIVSCSPALRVQTGNGLLELRRVQLEGEAELTGNDWARRHDLKEGARLT